METVDSKKKRCDGKNLRVLRNWNGWSQKEVGEKLSMSQTQIFDLELKDVIEEDTLKKFGELYGVSVDFFKKFNLEEVASKYSVSTNNYGTITGGENTEQFEYNNQKTVENEKNIYNNLDYYKELNERIVELEKRIAVYEYKESLK